MEGSGLPLKAQEPLGEKDLEEKGEDLGTFDQERTKKENGKVKRSVLNQNN